MVSSETLLSSQFFNKLYECTEWMQKKQQWKSLLQYSLTDPIPYSFEWTHCWDIPLWNPDSETYEEYGIQPKLKNEQLCWIMLTRLGMCWTLNLSSNIFLMVKPKILDESLTSYSQVSLFSVTKTKSRPCLG